MPLFTCLCAQHLAFGALEPDHIFCQTVGASFLPFLPLSSLIFGTQDVSHVGYVKDPPYSLHPSGFSQWGIWKGRGRKQGEIDAFTPLIHYCLVSVTGCFPLWWGTGNL